MSTIGLIFALLVAFQLKHWLADFPLQQNQYMLGKFKPGWGFFFPLLAHVSVHFVFTVLIATQVIAACGHGYAHEWHQMIPVAWGIALVDATVHFFMDRIKASARYMGRWKPVTPAEYAEYRANAEMSDGQCISEGSFQSHFKRRDRARKALIDNKLFWCALGFDQMVHHLTHYGCIYLILCAAGKL